MFDTLIGARGRGLGKLLEGLYNGDPGAWTIVGVIVAIAAAWYGFKFYLARSAANSEA